MAREISEHDATLAVDAAAKHIYETKIRPNTLSILPDWEDFSAVQKRNLKDQVLGIVWAALGALPDQRHTAWLEGCLARDNGRDAGDNPYPAEEA